MKDPSYFCMRGLSAVFDLSYYHVGVTLLSCHWLCILWCLELLVPLRGLMFSQRSSIWGGLESAMPSWVSVWTVKFVSLQHTTLSFSFLLNLLPTLQRANRQVWTHPRSEMYIWKSLSDAGNKLFNLVKPWGQSSVVCKTCFYPLYIKGLSFF